MLLTLCNPWHTHTHIYSIFTLQSAGCTPPSTLTAKSACMLQLWMHLAVCCWYDVTIFSVIEACLAIWPPYWDGRVARSGFTFWTVLSENAGGGTCNDVHLCFICTLSYIVITPPMSIGLGTILLYWICFFVVVRCRLVRSLSPKALIFRWLKIMWWTGVVKYWLQLLLDTSPQLFLWQSPALIILFISCYGSCGCGSKLALLFGSYKQMMKTQ